MACNGFNHPPDCTCAFRGGNTESRPPSVAPAAPLLGTLAPPAWRPKGRLRSSNPCPRCGMPTYYVPGPRGGSYTAAGDGSYLKHRCPRAVPTEPLRLRKAAWRKEWFTAGVRAKRRAGRSQRLEITGIAEGAPFAVEVLDGLQINANEPAMCRWSRTEPDVLEISYLDSDSGEINGTVIRARRLVGKRS